MDDDLVREFCKFTGKSFEVFVKEAAFALGCFILPKYMVKSFSLDVSIINKSQSDLSRAEMNLKKRIHQFFDGVNYKVFEATQENKKGE